jgi:hypothetical protein
VAENENTMAGITSPPLWWRPTNTDLSPLLPRAIPAF